MRTKNLLLLMLAALVVILIAPGLYLLLHSPMPISVQSFVDEVRDNRDEISVGVKRTKAQLKDENRLLEVRKRYEDLAVKGNSVLESARLGLDTGNFSEQEIKDKVTDVQRGSADLTAYIESVAQIPIKRRLRLVEAGFGEEMGGILKHWWKPLSSHGVKALRLVRRKYSRSKMRWIEPSGRRGKSYGRLVKPMRGPAGMMSVLQRQAFDHRL